MRTNSDVDVVMLISAYISEIAPSSIKLLSTLENAKGKMDIRAFTM
jgi:hypothetical protein